MSTAPSTGDVTTSSATHRRTAQPALLCLLVLLCLIPFIRKPIHVDDPLFVWAAKHIADHPFDPYGFEVNWFANYESMATATKNPPLTCYYLALAGSALGWSEPRLHAAMLLPALAAVLGTFSLAHKLCRRSFEAAVCALLAPAFFVSATTLMCDVMMLAFWVWAVYFWLAGIECGRFGRLILSGVLITLAVFTKYFAAALIPLLLLHGLLRKRSLGVWILPLFIPVLSAVVYHFWSVDLYGRSLLSDAVSYAEALRQVLGVSTLTALSFTGGCAATVLFLAHRLWPFKGIAALLAAMAASFAALWLTGYVPGVIEGFHERNQAIVQLQLSVWSVTGFAILALAASDLWRKRDAEAVLLFAWIAGTFWFAGFVNWSVNARSVLPMIPAVMIVAMRRLDERDGTQAQPAGIRPWMTLALAAALSYTVAHADLVTAAIGRATALQVCRLYRPQADNVWFVGHWGFQYYMQECGAKPVDQRQVDIREGDIVAVPYENTCLVVLPMESLNLLQRIIVRAPRWAETKSELYGAAFYSSTFGPLPFVIWPQDMGRVDVYTATTDIIGSVEYLNLRDEK